MMAANVCHAPQLERAIAPPSSENLGLQPKRGCSAKERATPLGHRTTAVNEDHYEALLPGRERALIEALPVFRMAG